MLDAEGEPLPDTQVCAIRAEWERGKRIYRQVGSADANDRGEFRLAGLAPGRYRIFTKGPRNGSLRFAISEGPGTPSFISRRHTSLPARPSTPLRPWSYPLARSSVESS